jgi:hypothetical protein
VNNTVESWLTPTAPQYGCTNILETGDPVVAIGFAMGTNTFDQGPNPDTTQSADGFYHPEDEVFLPWFMRTAPNTVSEPTQSPSTNIGRYTLMGDPQPVPRLPRAGDRLLAARALSHRGQTFWSDPGGISARRQERSTREPPTIASRPSEKRTSALPLPS